MSSLRALYVRGCGTDWRVVQNPQGVTKLHLSQTVLERLATEGESPVGEMIETPCWYLSRAGHEKPCLNLGGPPSKAKYETATDSAEVP